MPRIPHIFAAACVVFCVTLPAFGDLLPSTLDFAGKQASSISEKRVAISKWNEQPNATLTRKTFPIEEWGKRYSSLGSKRAAFGTDQTVERKVYEKKTKEFPIKEVEMSRWNDRIADLQKKARVGTDDRVKDIEEKRVYDLMMQDAKQYKDLGKKLSLRDINRYQFRSNRSDGEVPVQQAGEGDAK